MRGRLGRSLIHVKAVLPFWRKMELVQIRQQTRGEVLRQDLTRIKPGEQLADERYRYRPGIFDTTFDIHLEEHMILSTRNGSSFPMRAMPVVACLACCIASISASAADDLITLDIGGYRFNARNDISVGGPTIAGTNFRMEREGTPDNDSILRLDGTIRPFARHRLRFMYLDSSREGSAATDRDISFRDSVIPAGTAVNSGFTLREVELDYMYSFWKSEATEVALSLGIHSTSMEARLSAPSFNITRTADADGPLPMIGIAASTRIANRWELLGHVYGMKASISDFSGSALAYRFGGRYFFTPNIGVGIAYAGINYHLDVTKSSWLGQLDASNKGGEVFFTVRF